MRILQVNHFGHRVGGGEAYIAEVHRALVDSGESTLLAYCEPELETPMVRESLSLAHSGTPAHRRRGLIENLRRILAEWMPDAVYIHAVYTPAIIKYLASRLPTVAYIHSPYPVCLGSAYYLRRSNAPCNRAFGPYCLLQAQTESCCWGRNPARHAAALARACALRRAYRKVGTIVVGSEYMRDLLVRNKYAAQNIGILPPVLLTGPTPRSRPKQDRSMLLFAARLVREKGLHLLLEALAQVEVRWTLLVAGDGEEKPNLQRLARKLGIGDRVRFLGFLDANMMSAMLELCAFVVIPSLWPEPFGRLGPEASMYAKPAIAFDVGGIGSWLDDGVTGYLVSLGDVTGLARAVTDLLLQPDLCLAMGEKARKKAEIEWGREHHMNQLSNLFSQRICAGHAETHQQTARNGVVSEQDMASWNDAQ